MAGLKYVVVAELALDSGTEYVSGERVRRGSIIYLGTVLNWGSIERSIPSPPGMPQISGAKIRIADPKRKWRDLLGHQVLRRRIMQLTLMPEGASIADYPPCFVGEVEDAEFPPAAFEIALRDRTFSWLDETLPVMRDFDADAIDGDMVFPIVNGEMRSSPFTAQGIGMIALPYVGVVNGYDEWGVAAHPIHDLVAVYREEEIDASPPYTSRVLVDPSEYNLIPGARTVFGVLTHPTYLDFWLPQPPGTKLWADIDGINYRGAWGTLPEVGYNSSASPPYGTSEALRNPIDFFINLTYLLMSKAGESLDAFDADDIAALRTAMDGVYFCDGAITEQMTARALLGRFLGNFNLDMFCKRNGKITLNFTDEEDESRQIFKEGKHILKESFSERLPSQISNLIVANYQYSPADGIFQKSQKIPIADVLAFPDGAPKVEKEVLDFYFVHDFGTVDAIARLRNRFLSVGSFRQQFSMPAPAVIDDLELGKLIGITHSMGLEIGGYVNKEAKVIGLTLDLDRLVMNVRTILRVPQSIVRPWVVETIAGQIDTPDHVDDTGNAARFWNPQGIWGDGTYLYITDTQNFVVRRLEIATNEVTTIAGGAGIPGNTDDVNGLNARFGYATSIWGYGNYLYVADRGVLSYPSYPIKIRRINLTTTEVETWLTLEPLGLSGSFAAEVGLAGDSNYLYISKNQVIRKADLATATLTLVAGTYDAIGYVDDTGAAARFNHPRQMWSDGTDLYVADELNFLIRKIVLATGVVTTIAGVNEEPATEADAIDGTRATARFYSPIGLWGDGAGYLYVSEYERLRRVDLSSGAVLTMAGVQGEGGCADSPEARFHDVTRVWGDSATGIIYLATGCQTILEVTPL